MVLLGATYRARPQSRTKTLTHGKQFHYTFTEFSSAFISSREAQSEYQQTLHSFGVSYAYSRTNLSHGHSVAPSSFQGTPTCHQGHVISGSMWRVCTSRLCSCAGSQSRRTTRFTNKSWCDHTSKTTFAIWCLYCASIARHALISPQRSRVSQKPRSILSSAPSWPRSPIPGQ